MPDDAGIKTKPLRNKWKQTTPKNMCGDSQLTKFPPQKGEFIDYRGLSQIRRTSRRLTRNYG